VSVGEPDAKEVADVRGKLTKAAYELNLLLKVAHSYGLAPSVDTVDRGHPEVIVHTRAAHDRG
jgi:hypothetical protein